METIATAHGRTVPWTRRINDHDKCRKIKLVKRKSLFEEETLMTSKNKEVPNEQGSVCAEGLPHTTRLNKLLTLDTKTTLRVI